MKKIYPYLIGTVLVVAGFFACERIDFTTQFGSLSHVRSMNKSLNDGRFDVVYLGNGYQGNQATSLWFKNLDSAKFAFRQTFFQHDSITRFWSKKLNGRNPLGCNDRAIGQGNIETIVCNPEKVIDAAQSVVPSGVQIDLVIILANGFGHASHDGSYIVAVGLGAQLPPPSCTFNRAAFWNRQPHEVGHFFGLSHDNTYGNKMNDCVSGGCGCWFPFSPAQYDTINFYFN